ncbi:MAG: arginyltransferase [Lysobacterales bacterium]
MRRDAMADYPIRFFLTREHRCGYFEDRLARNVLLDPKNPLRGDYYAHALTVGYRRSASNLYSPRCLDCQACVSARLPTERFQADRSQLRCWRQNADLGIDISPAHFDEDLYRLYRRYLEGRHPDSTATQGEAEHLRELLETPWANTQVLRIHRDGQLLAAAITDCQISGLSAVYTFFDPEQSRRSLGVFAILAQIEWARREKLPHLYLGFWIDQHPKMGYKTRFQPLELFHNQYWQTHYLAPAVVRTRA